MSTFRRVLTWGAIPAIAWIGWRVTEIVWASDGMLAVMAALTFGVVAITALIDAIEEELKLAIDRREKAPETVVR